MSPRKVNTRDGSATLYSERYRQHYHNISGALTESRHVFFNKTGITDALLSHRDFTICEIGFGTGFHVQLLEWLHREMNSKSRIQYHSVEKYPVNGDLIRQMDFHRLFVPSNVAKYGQPGTETPVDRLISLSDTLVRSKPGTTIHVDLSSIAVHIFRGDFYDWNLTENDPKRPRYSSHIPQTDKSPVSSAETVDSESGPVHFILFDAFSPEVNPELWTPAVFSKLLTIARKDAVLGTYCSATRARAAMALAGWHVARAEGPPGKREMTLASPSEALLIGYKRVNEVRLCKRFGDTWPAASFAKRGGITSNAKR